MLKYFLVLAGMISSEVMADYGVVSGNVQYIRTHNDSLYASTWAPPLFWFTIEGVTTAGSCRKYGNNVLFVMDSEQAYSMVMAAYMANKAIAVKFDDELLTDTNYCKAKYVTVGNPPPTS